jgi:hypothetical protein
VKVFGRFGRRNLYEIAPWFHGIPETTVKLQNPSWHRLRVIEPGLAGNHGRRLKHSLVAQTTPISWGQERHGRDPADKEPRPDLQQAKTHLPQYVQEQCIPTLPLAWELIRASVHLTFQVCVAKIVSAHRGLANVHPELASATDPWYPLRQGLCRCPLTRMLLVLHAATRAACSVWVLCTETGLALRVLQTSEIG